MAETEVLTKEELAEVSEGLAADIRRVNYRLDGYVNLVRGKLDKLVTLLWGVCLGLVIALGILLL